MEKWIRVNVFRQGDRPGLVAEWRDPHTGKLKRRSTGTKVRRDAERIAAKIEKEVNEGTYQAKHVTWKDFRQRYVDHRKVEWAPATLKRVNTVLDTVEAYIKPGLLRGVDSAAVLKIHGELIRKGLSPAGIASVLRHLKAALRWALRKRLIREIPDIEMPKEASKAGGRAVTGEEFDRWLEAIAKEVPKADVESWKRALWLLWNSGLRIGEAVKLDWTNDRHLTVDLSGKFPRFVIAAGTSKNRKHQKFPMAPECYRWLMETPEAERQGLMIRPTIGGSPVGYGCVVKIIARSGKAAGIIVGRDSKDEPVFASAHDLRRSAATRWAAKVQPAVLQAYMRHASPATTAKFYTDRSAEPIASALWEAMGVQPPTTIAGTIDANEKTAST